MGLLLAYIGNFRRTSHYRKVCAQIDGRARHNTAEVAQQGDVLTSAIQTACPEVIPPTQRPPSLPNKESISSVHSSPAKSLRLNETAPRSMTRASADFIKEPDNDKDLEDFRSSGFHFDILTWKIQLSNNRHNLAPWSLVRHRSFADVYV